jgi:hypothetical protein
MPFSAPFKNAVKTPRRAQGIHTPVFCALRLMAGRFRAFWGVFTAFGGAGKFRFANDIFVTV